MTLHWQRDEFILALSTLRSLERGGYPSIEAAAAALSRELRSLWPRLASRHPSLRTETSCGSKLRRLSDIAAGRIGSDSPHPIELEVIATFGTNPELLEKVAALIRDIALGWFTLEDLRLVFNQAGDSQFGRLPFALHRALETDPRRAQRLISRRASEGWDETCDGCRQKFIDLMGRDWPVLAHTHAEAPIPELNARGGRNGRIGRLSVLCPTCHELKHHRLSAGV